jgi:2-keto-4-pentenoate hydratase/2-oxohepta-3-ene-1,7-dioic acid hydratase in catechol pathway
MTLCSAGDLHGEVDYEVELGFVIGKRAQNVPESEAMDYVAGYSIVHDVSARDLQFREVNQWDHGKSVDTFCPWALQSSPRTKFRTRKCLISACS